MTNPPIEQIPRPYATFSIDAPMWRLLNGCVKLLAARYATTPTWTSTTDARQLGMAAFALTTVPQAQAFDTGLTGLSSYTIPNSRGLALAQLVADHHLINTPGGWGASWQSPLWAYYAVMTGWLNTWYLTDGQQQQFVDVAVYEADRLLAIPPRFMYAPDGTITTPGDSGAEENAWDATILTTAACMLPTHPHAADWHRQAIIYGLSSFTHQNDLGSTVVINGLPVHSSINGWNVEADYTVTNHGKNPHPDYTACIALLAQAALPYHWTGRAAPAGLLWNFDKVYGSLSAPLPAYDGRTMYVPGYPPLSIFYPQGNDWGSHRAPDTHLICDVAARVYGLDGYSARDAGYYERQHIREEFDMAGRYTTGQIYGPLAEFNYGGREELAAANLANAFWLQFMHAFGRASTTTAPAR